MITPATAVDTRSVLAPRAQILDRNAALAGKAEPAASAASTARSPPR